MAAVIPQILINGKTPRPDGLEADAQLALGATSVPLALASTVGITSFTWALVSAPVGATSSIANTAPAAPFNTTLNVLDQPGTYIFRGVPNGDAASAKEVAITVLNADGRRIPARAETGQWDGARWWFDAIVGLFADIVKRRIGRVDVPVVTGTTTASEAQYQKRILRATGALTATSNLILPLTGVDDPSWIVENATTGGFALIVKGATGTGVTVLNGGVASVVSNGTNFVNAVGTNFGSQSVITTGTCSFGAVTCTTLSASSAVTVAATGYVRFNGSSCIWNATSTSAQGEAQVAQKQISTTDATPVSIDTWGPAASTINKVVVEVLAIKSDGTAHYEQLVKATFRVDGAGVITEMGTNSSDAAKTNGTTAGLAVAIDSSGASIRVRVTGRAAETWRWTVHTRVMWRSAA